MAETTWWQGIRFPPRVRQAATYAYLTTTRQALLRCLVFCLLFSCVLSAVPICQRHIRYPGLPQAEPLGMTELILGQLLPSMLEGWAWMSGQFVFMTVAALCAIAIRSRRRKRDWRGKPVSRSKIAVLALKAAAATMPLCLWIMTAIGLLSLPLWFVVTSSLFANNYVQWLYAAFLVILLVAFCAWPSLASARCGLRIVGHCFRVRCVSCGYDLQGTPGDRCSECGMVLPALPQAEKE